MTNFWTLANGYFHRLKRLVFNLEDSQTSFLTLISTNTNNKKVHIFDPNHGLTPLENDKFLDVRK